jgi:hypothetical protein
MNNRRKFIKSGLTGLAGISLLPAVNAFAGDGLTKNLIGWLTREHQQNHLDFVIVNGDLVHNRPDLLIKVKETYLDKLPVPFYTIPGNHDFADAEIWKRVFGYEDKYTFEFGDIGFVLANTADTKGGYVCPDNAFLKASFEKFKSKSIVFAILHIPPHQWMPEEKDIFLNCPETVDLLHAYPNIKAAFHGHDHTLDGVRYTNKLPHFFDSHFGGNWGTDYKGYRIVEVNNNNQIFTFQVNASQNPRLNTTKI